MDSNYNVEDDEYYKNHISKPSINENTAEKYKKILRKFCRATNKTLDEIIRTCIDEQNIITTIDLPPDSNGNKRKREIRFDINSKDAAIKQYINQYIEYCKKRNNNPITINREIGDIKAFLRGTGVILPKIENLEEDPNDWNLLTKEDFNFILQDMNIVHAGLLNFLSSTGMRISDALSLSIGDFMDATSEDHNFVDVGEFIDNAPDDMIGQWVFEPQKTKKHHIKCITFNSTHTSNLILQNLRRIKNQYLPYRNKKDGTNIKISKNDALFGSRSAKYKEPVSGKTIAEQWYNKNKKFKKWKINQIEQKIKNGELSAEDYDAAVAEIPKFHAHGCRKFFISTVAEHCGDIRVSALLEGHSGGLKTDKSYVKKSVEEIKDIYINDIHDALCLSNVETRIVSNKETEALNKKVSESNEKIEVLTKDNEKKDEKIAELEQIIVEAKEEARSTKEIVKEFTQKRNSSDIQRSIHEHFERNYRKDINKKGYENDDMNIIKKDTVICELATEFALEKEKFNGTEEELDSVIKKAIAKCSFNPEIIQEKYKLIHQQNERKLEDAALISSIKWDIKIIISNHEEIWELVKDDEENLDKTIINTLVESDYDLNNIADNDLEKISEEIIMDYLS